MKLILTNRKDNIKFHALMNLHEHYIQAAELIKKSSKILLVAHRRPDGDTLGASVALRLVFKQMGKSGVLACVDEIPSRLTFIPETENFVKSFNLNEFNLIIISDAGAHHMTGFHEVYPEFLSKRIPIINIDHHASNESFGTINIVDSYGSSTTMLVWKLIKMLDISISKEIALALLAGIYSDTGSFMHANTTQETFKAASDILKAQNIPVIEVVRPLFKQFSLGQLRLWGYILENIKVNENGVFSSVISEEDFKSIGAHSSDTGGIIDLINTIPDAAFTMLIAEDEGFVKGSLRTRRDDVNVSDIAGQFGGGGHKKASGFRLHGRLVKQTVWKIVPDIAQSKKSRD